MKQEYERGNDYIKEGLTTPRAGAQAYDGRLDEVKRRWKVLWMAAELSTDFD